MRIGFIFFRTVDHDAVLPAPEPPTQQEKGPPIRLKRLSRSTNPAKGDCYGGMTRAGRGAL